MKKKMFVFLVLSFILFISSINADECSYKDRAALNKSSANVSASYEMIDDGLGNISFKISVYNITDDLLVSISNDYNSTTEIVSSSNSTDGVYSFYVNNTNKVITYKFVVSGNLNNCDVTLRNFTLIKPKKNKFYDYDECKYETTKDISYCKEWITKEFTLSDEDILETIEQQRQRNMKFTTTRCLSCEAEEKYQQQLKKEKMIKTIIVSVVSTLISLNIIYIYLRVSNIRRAEI